MLVNSTHPLPSNLQMPRIISIALSLCLPLLACTAHADDVQTLHAGDTQLEVAVIGVPDAARTAMLQRWFAQVAKAPLTVSGRFPLHHARVEIRQVHGRDDDPVPWGQTEREDDVRVLLYVRDDASYDELLHDWTAVHELAHLFHPYLGDRGRWLAEGLASYEQNVLRARVGLLSPQEAWRRLDGGFARGQHTSAPGRLDALGRNGTMRTYWAGALYWLQADLALRRQHHTTLDAVLGEYSSCCLRGTAWVAPRDFVEALDRIAGADVFTALYRRYAGSTQFPPLDDTYRELGIERSEQGLRFGGDRQAARLREQVMGPKAPAQP